MKNPTKNYYINTLLNHPPQIIKHLPSSTMKDSQKTHQMNKYLINRKLIMKGLKREWFPIDKTRI